MFTDSPLDAYIISGNTVLQHSFVFSPTTSVLLTQFCIAKNECFSVGRDGGQSYRHIRSTKSRSFELQQIAWTGAVANWHLSFVYELLFSSLFVAIDLL